MKSTLLSLLLIALLCSCSNEEPPLLNATFQVDKDFIYIENKEAFDLTDVDVVINDDYRFTIDILKAGKTHAQPWVNITTKGTNQIKSVFIFGYAPNNELRNVKYER
jgi:hypothetical protein